jgi:predicted DNA-binding transcriptional regulator AlpA
LDLSCFTNDPYSEGKQKTHDTLCKTYPQRREYAMSKYSDDALLRLAQVLELIPVSRSAWWAGCKSGRYPKPIKLGPRTTAWKMADLRPVLDGNINHAVEAVK